MRTRRRATIEDLRRAVTCLPTATKVAMLEGIRANAIIVGAYATHDGICPMLAAHRSGGRTSLISFARAWDRYAFANGRTKRVRRATEHELLVLRAMLEGSLLEEQAPWSDLARAIADHRELLERSRERAARHSPPPGPACRRRLGLGIRRRGATSRQPDRGARPAILWT